MITLEKLLTELKAESLNEIIAGGNTRTNRTRKTSTRTTTSKSKTSTKSRTKTSSHH